MVAHFVPSILDVRFFWDPLGDPSWVLLGLLRDSLAAPGEDGDFNWG